MRDNGATIIFSTHNMESVEQLCDHIALINKSKKILDGSVKDIRQTYKSDVFMLELENSTSDVKAMINGHFELLETKQDGNLHQVKIKIAADASPNELLQAVLPHAQVQSFREILPSMNDIFISKVTSDANNSNTDF